MSFESPEAAFDALSKNSDLTWILCQWDKSKSQLVFVEAGNGDLAEFKSKLDSKSIFFGAYKVLAVDQQENVSSVRVKLIQITWVGNAVSPLSRNSVLSSKPARVKLFQGCALDVQADDEEFLTEKSIARNLLLSGGAHKPTFYQFGETKIPLEDL